MSMYFLPMGIMMISDIIRYRSRGHLIMHKQRG